MQPVQTWSRLGVPLTVARTRWMLGSKRRLVIFRDHGRLLPKPGFLWQMSQTAAISGLLGDVETFMGPGSGQPQKDIRTGRCHPIRSNPSSLAPVSEPGTVGSGIQLATVLRFVDIAVDALAGAREEIDALNVYPVPDGDTGTNMYLTMAAARDAVRERTSGSAEADRAATFDAFTRGALLGARGNSGVILSEMLRAIIRRIAEARPE